MDIKFLPIEHDSAAAAVEFETQEDAAAALTRDQKRIDGQTVDVEKGSGSTVYVTNFPPTADEAFIRSLFSEVCAIWYFEKEKSLTVVPRPERLSKFASHLSSTTHIAGSVTSSSSQLIKPLLRPCWTTMSSATA